MQRHTSTALRCDASTLACHTDKMMSFAPVPLEVVYDARTVDLIRKGDLTTMAVQAPHVISWTIKGDSCFTCS
jgi:hypothetical protein